LIKVFPLLLPGIIPWSAIGNIKYKK